MMSITARPRARLAVVALIFTALFLAGPLGSDHAEAFGRPARIAKRLVNRERDSHGLRRLKWDSRIRPITRSHTRRMAERNKLYHNPNLAREARNIPWRVIGENVGVGMTVRSLHRAFMNSSAHRHNVLNGRYRRVSISVVKGQGRTWMTFVFAG